MLEQIKKNSFWYVWRMGDECLKNILYESQVEGDKGKGKHHLSSCLEPLRRGN